MADINVSFEGFSLRDVPSDDDDDFVDAAEEFAYQPSEDRYNDELLKLINLKELLGGEDDDEDYESPLYIGMQFDEIKEKMVDLTSDGRVKKLIRREGTGKVVPPDALVTLKYSGYFDGCDEPYDCSQLRGTPETFQLGQRRLTVGFEIAIRSMKKQEVSIFWMHPDHAFGELGCPPLIPPDTEIIYIVSLLDYVDRSTANNLKNLSIEEKRKFVNVREEVANLFVVAADKFRHESFMLATFDYDKIRRLLEAAEAEDENEEREKNSLLTRAAQNLAVCYNKLNMPDFACSACESAPQKNAKIHFHYGRALIKVGEYRAALDELEKCLELEPTNLSTTEEIQQGNELLRKYTAIEQEIQAVCSTAAEVSSDQEETFSKLAAALCKTFSDDKGILRYPLSIDLVPAAEKALRSQASSAGLEVTSRVKLDKEILYLNKAQ